MREFIQVLGVHSLPVIVEITLADTGSVTTGPSVDEQATFEIDRLRKPGWRIGQACYIS